MGGISLVTQELVAPWDLPKSKVHTFCMVVELYINTLMNGMGKMRTVEDIKMPGWWKERYLRIKNWIRSSIAERSEFIFSLIYRYRLEDDLVKTPSSDYDQVGKVTPAFLESLRQRIPFMGSRENTKRLDIHTNMYLDYPNEEELPSCPVCFDLHGQLGCQIIECRPSENTEHVFALTDTELGAMKAKLLNSDNDPAGLKEVKDRALKNLPKGAFERRVKINYVRAGPGCGKSYIIRKLADENDLILSPFAKLKPDYEKLVSDHGVKYDLPFKTTHRAMETRGYSRIFVDEFTSFPYEYLACIISNNACDEVFLVGDERQTKLRDPDEGIYISNKIDVQRIPIHELLVNFRNPKDTVALLNKLYGYRMRSASDLAGPSIKVVKQSDDVVLPKSALQMCFSNAAAKSITQNEDNTVRSNQGGTYAECILYATSFDKNIITNENRYRL